MSTIVVMPGGFHPFHAGHYALYKSAVEAFPGAEVYVAATNAQEERPFPFSIKEKLAKVAGVKPGHFIQVKSPFQPREITDKFNPQQDVLIFVRSEKDKNESPKPGGTKKDGTPAYFQPYTGKDLVPFGQHAYIAYLPTVKFGPGITSATEIRKAWPTLDDRRKTAMVMSLYPAAQKNPKLAKNIVQMMDIGMGGGESLEEDTHTFAGKDPMSFKSPKGGTPTMLLVTAQGSRYLITSDGMVLRNKSFHTNTGGEDQGLKSWSDAIEFYDPNEKPGNTTFPMAVSTAVEKGLPVTLSKTKDGKRALLIYDGSQWKVAKISDIYKHVATTDDPIVSAFSTTPKLNWNVLDYTVNPNKTLKSVHPGSPVTHGVKLGAAQPTISESADYLDEK